MGSVDCDFELCFVCDKEVMEGGSILSVVKTNFTRTDFPTKIRQMMGDGFVVIVREEDMVCSSCTDLINELDELEMNLTGIKKQVTGLLNKKYNLDEDNEEESLLKDYELTKIKCDAEKPSLLTKTDNQKQTGNKGGHEFTETDNTDCDFNKDSVGLLFSEIGYKSNSKSTVINDLQTIEENNDIKINYVNTLSNKRKKKTHKNVTEEELEMMNLKQKKLKLTTEIMEKESYLKSLEILKLERQMGESQSEYTSQFPREY